MAAPGLDAVLAGRAPAVVAALALTLAQVCCSARAATSVTTPVGDVEAVTAAAYGVFPAAANDMPAPSSPAATAADSADLSAAQMLSFREATARVLEATHGWINCLLSARPRPPPEITRCTEAALPHVVEVLVAVSTAGWALRFRSQEELDPIRRAIQRMSDVRSQVHGCVESLGANLQVAGRCYTVL